MNRNESFSEAIFTTYLEHKDPDMLTILALRDLVGAVRARHRQQHFQHISLWS